MRTAFESPLDCAERNLSKMAVVYTREISGGAVNGRSEGLKGNVRPVLRSFAK